MIVPLVLLDLWVTLYQRICFPVYGIAQVRRSRHLVFDRRKLAYLNALEAFNCLYAATATACSAMPARSPGGPRNIGARSSIRRRSPNRMIATPASSIMATPKAIDRMSTAFAKRSAASRGNPDPRDSLA